MNSMTLPNIESGSTFPTEILMKMVSVDKEQLAFVRSGLQSLDELELVQQFRYKILETIQAWSDVLLDSEIKIGDKLKNLPKFRGKPKKDCSIQVTCEFEPQRPKSEIIEELGLKKDQARRFEMLSENKELIEQLRAEASEYNQFPTTQKILRSIREQKELRKQKFSKQQEAQEKAEYSAGEETQPQTLKPSEAYKKLNNILLDFECLNDDDEYFNALTEWYAVEPSMVDPDLERLSVTLTKFLKLSEFLLILRMANSEFDKNSKSGNNAPADNIKFGKNKRGVKNLFQDLIVKIKR